MWKVISSKKEAKKPKHKAVKDDKKDNNDNWRCGGHGYNNTQYEGDWIEVGATKNNTNKIKVKSAPLPNDSTFILLSDDHGPRQPETTQQPNTAIAIEQTYTISERLHNKEEKQDQKLKRRIHRRQMLQRLAQQDDHFLEESITAAEDEHTARA